MTRAIIKLSKNREEDLYFYSHCNGNPTNMLVDIIHMQSKDFYPDFVEELGRKFDEIYGLPGDIDFAYLIDWDDQMIETYDARFIVPSKNGLLRKDRLYTDVIEIED